jgi:hypothetical protein
MDIGKKNTSVVYSIRPKVNERLLSRIRCLYVSSTKINPNKLIVCKEKVKYLCIMEKLDGSTSRHLYCDKHSWFKRNSIPRTKNGLWGYNTGKKLRG